MVTFAHTYNSRLFNPSWVVRGVARIRDIGCAHPEFAPYLARIRCLNVRCAHPWKQGFWLRASVSNFTVASIRIQNLPCMHPYWDSPKTPVTLVLLPGFYNRGIFLEISEFFLSAHIFFSSVQFFTLNLENSDKTKSRGVNCDRANLD